MKAPYDPDAEAVLIGGCLVWPGRVGEFVDQLAIEDFYVPAHQAMWGAITRLYQAGHPIDPVAVVDAAQRFGGVEAADVMALMVDALPPQQLHVDIILRYRLTRSLTTLYGTALVELESGEDPAVNAERLVSEVGRIDTPLLASTTHRARTLDDIIATAEERAPWIIPGLFRARWRALLVALEGSGKSTLTRQIAACAAQGVHPLKFTSMPRVRTLVIDPENDEATIAETGEMLVRALRQRVGRDYDPEAMKTVVWPGGFDLRMRRDRLEVEAEIAAHRPQLTVIGSLYQTFSRRDKESHEEATEPLLKIFDSWRARYDTALFIEHHAPQGSGGYREMRPYGSSLFLRWPEIGLNIREDRMNPGQWNVGKWRGDRQINGWPAVLLRGGQPWPWEGIWPRGDASRFDPPPPRQDEAPF